MDLLIWIIPTIAHSYWKIMGRLCCKIVEIKIGGIHGLKNSYLGKSTPISRGPRGNSNSFPRGEASRDRIGIVSWPEGWGVDFPRYEFLGPWIHIPIRYKENFDYETMLNKTRIGAQCCEYTGRSNAFFFIRVQAPLLRTLKLQLPNKLWIRANLSQYWSYCNSQKFLKAYWRLVML